MPFAVVVDHSVRVVEPAAPRGEVELRAIGFGVELVRARNLGGEFQAFEEL
jgi:hypothetical protein